MVVLYRKPHYSEACYNEDEVYLAQPIILRSAIYEPHHEKINNAVTEQVRHKR